MPCCCLLGVKWSKALRTAQQLNARFHSPLCIDIVLNPTWKLERKVNKQLKWKLEGLNKCAARGDPLSVFYVRCVVIDHLGWEGKVVLKFKGNIPGPVWALIKRQHNQLSNRNIKKSRTATGPESMNAYFEEFGATLEDVPPHLHYRMILDDVGWFLKNDANIPNESWIRLKPGSQ